MLNISGKVVRGDGYGRKIGFPTMNLETGEQILPEEGVYAARRTLEDKKYRAGIIVGPNNKTEAHVIEYSGDAYGKIVTLEINKFLRNYIKFNTEEELIIQIKKDLEQC